MATAYSDIYKTKVVLKILYADTNEEEALRFYNGQGCVKLLDYDADTKSFLLEYISPGTSLKTFFPAQDIQAVLIACEIIKKLNKKQITAEHIKNFKTINVWLALLNTFQSKKIPPYLIHKAQSLSKILWATINPAELHLLHGDLHHENILQSEQEWIAIDPKGVIGPLEYEVGRFIMNPIPDLLNQPHAVAIIARRIEQFSSIFGLDKQRLFDWLFVQSVLSACWTEEGGSQEFFNYFIEFAGIVDRNFVL